jgi:hypothetical protein
MKFTPGATKSSSKRKRLEEDMQSSELQIVDKAKAKGLLSPSTPSQTISQLRDRLRSSSAEKSSSSSKKMQPSTTPPEKRSKIAAKGAPEEVIVLDNEEEVGDVSYTVSKLCCLGTKYYNTGRALYDFDPWVRPARDGRYGKVFANVDRVSEILVRDPIRFSDDDAYSAWNLGFTFSVDPRVKPETNKEKWMVFSLWGWLDAENPRFVILQQAYKLCSRNRT